MKSILTKREFLKKLGIGGAGRCLGAADSVDTFRLICPCFVTGQAAGTAAALCAKGNVSPRNLPYPELCTALADAKVFLG